MQFTYKILFKPQEAIQRINDISKPQMVLIFFWGYFFYILLNSIPYILLFASSSIDIPILSGFKIKSLQMYAVSSLYYPLNIFLSYVVLRVTQKFLKVEKLTHGICAVILVSTNLSYIFIPFIGFIVWIFHGLYCYYKYINKEICDRNYAILISIMWLFVPIIIIMLQLKMAQ